MEAVFELMRASLETGEQVKISGFGVFEVKEKKERRGRNPQLASVCMASVCIDVANKCQYNINMQTMQISNLWGY